MKESKHFDEIIREKVADYSVPLAEDAWAAFSDKLEVATADEMLDQKAAQLQAHEVPFNRSHWALMAERIRKELVFIRELTHLKTMELSLMALMLLTLWQQMEVVEQNQEHHYRTGAPIALYEEDTQDRSWKAEERSLQSAVHNSQSLTSSGGKKALQSVSTLTPTVSFRVVNGKIPIQKAPINTYIKEETFNIQQPLEELKGASPIKTLVAKSFSIKQKEDAKLFINPYLPKRNNTYLKIGMIGSSEYNTIITATDNIPTRQILKSKIYKQVASGYSGGMSIGLARGHWEYHLKLFYTALRYTPIDIINTVGNSRGYVGRKYVNFEFNTLRIPIEVRHNIIDRKKWKLFTSLGVSGHLVTQSFYHQKEEILSKNKPAPSLHRYNEPVGADDALPGFLQSNGKLERNLYFSGNIGIGIERSFSGKWSTYIASRYSYAFHHFGGGLGPYKDQVHSLSIESGIVVKFLR